MSVNKYGRKAPIFKIVNGPFLNTVTITLSHLLQDYWSEFFKTCLRCLTSCLVFKFLSTRKWLQSVDKYGHRQTSLINLFVAFSSDLLVLYCPEFDDTILLENNNYSNQGSQSYIFMLITNTSFSKSQFTVLMFSFTC